MSMKNPMPTVAWEFKKSFVANLGKVQVDKLRILYARFSTDCAHCHNAIDLDDYYESRHLKCSACGTVTCGGCGRRTDPQTNCCADDIIFKIWMLLGCLDAEESQCRESSPVVEGNPLNLPVLYKIRDATKGIGYANDFSHNNSGLGPSSGSQSTQTPSPLTEKQSDLEMTRTLRAIISLLPMVTFEHDHPTALVKDPVFARLRALFGRLFGITFLFDCVASVIRNDSITDMTERLELYQTIFEFIESISKIPQFSHFILESRRRAADLGVLAASPDPGPNESQLSPNNELSPSIFQLCKNPYRQAKVFLAYTDKQTVPPAVTRLRQKYYGRGKGKAKSKAKTNSDTTIDDPTLDIGPSHDDDSAKLCRLIVRVYEQFEQKKVVQALVQVDPLKAWDEYMEQNRVTYTDEVLKNHRYSKNFGCGYSGSFGRMGTITKEIGVLMTSLPPGIFVKVAESRSDVMKVLMVGVQGTPYDGGLFTFDMLLTPGYPKDPPKMLFTLEKADEDGRPINPNLHVATGTVCLSLLNTWQGDETQRWQPNKSTLLAVLVSVQSFILGAPSPYENEPSHAALGSTPQARQYKNSVQNKVVGRAMIPWIEKRDNADIWSAIVSKYWQYNGQDVLSRVKEAKCSNPLLEANWKRLNDLLDLPAPGGKKRKRDGETDTDEEPAAQRWSYTGEWTRQKIREACTELGAKPARSMNESVERLETAVNDNEMGETELGRKWGHTA